MDGRELVRRVEYVELLLCATVLAAPTTLLTVLHPEINAQGIHTYERPSESLGISREQRAARARPCRTRPAPSLSSQGCTRRC